MAGAVPAALLLILATACAAAPPKSPPAARGILTRATARPAFETAAASFVTSSLGWVLGRTGCGDCAGLLMTRDGGHRWTSLPAPPAPIGYDTQSPAAVTNLAFANARDGFLYGPAMLVTHDGGRSWTREPLPPLPVFTAWAHSFAIGAGYAYAVTQPSENAPYSLWRTSVASGTWTRLPLPRGAASPVAGNGSLSVYAEGSTVVLLRPGLTGPVAGPGQTGNLWVGSDGTKWHSRPVPCEPPHGGGAAVFAMALGHPGEWLLDCFNNEQSQQEQNTQHHLFGTANAGITWVRLADPASHGMPALLADNGSGHAFLAAAGVFDELRATFDGGHHWQTVLAPGGQFAVYADLTFLTARTGYVVVVTGSPPGLLYRTDDGGRTWHILPV
jgi:photosystem II stability/assembly factor-like uncharacterized protein